MPARCHIRIRSEWFRNFCLRLHRGNLVRQFLQFFLAFYIELLAEGLEPHRVNVFGRSNLPDVDFLLGFPGRLNLCLMFRL